MSKTDLFAEVGFETKVPCPHQKVKSQGLVLDSYNHINFKDFWFKESSFFKLFLLGPLCCFRPKKVGVFDFLAREYFESSRNRLVS